MNLSGPSLTVDTACSSSLTAIYLACESINSGECSAAIVGGANLDLHQAKLDINKFGGALSEDGVSRAFGKGANGYVAGEGIGALFLKPLDQAVQDGDNIYGVIKSAVVNHGGRTAGFTVPNPKAQSNLILAALEKANLDARSIGYIEAHIEQGRTLESGDLRIGVVTSIVGIWQYRITFTGEQNHAGTTRMDVRKDAGLALARFCVDIDDRFPLACGPRTVWTTGRITLDPGAPSIIPGAAEMLFQMRDDDPGVIDRLEDLLRSMAADVTAQGRCSVAVERLRTGSPAMMDATFQHAIEAASAVFAGGRSVRMPSGAGHDAQVLATIMPAGMMFVPSIGGISHHWSENTDDADIVTGAQVFVEACRRLLVESA